MPQLAGADESWEQMHARLAALLAERAYVVRVDAAGDLEATVDVVRDVLRRPQTGR